MAPDAEALRAILKQYIGPAYDRALRNTGEPEAAKEATRRAMELLRETRASVAEIAAQVGYESQGKFTKAFKDVTQQLPTQYRRQL